MVACVVLCVDGIAFDGCHVVVGCVAAADSLTSELRTDVVSGSEASATEIDQSCRDGERCIAASVSDHRLLLPIF